MDWSALSEDEKARLVWEINQAIHDSPYSLEAKRLEDYIDSFADYDGPDAADLYEWEQEMEAAGLDPEEYDFEYDWEHGTLGGRTHEEVVRLANEEYLRNRAALDEEDDNDNDEEEKDTTDSDERIKDKKPNKGCVSDETMKNVVSALSDRRD